MSDGLWGKLKGLFQSDETPPAEQPKIVIPEVVLQKTSEGQTAVSQPPITTIDAIFLRQQMSNHLDDSQLARMAAGMALDYVALPGGKGRKVLELVTAFEKEGKLDQLLQQCQAENSDVAWQMEKKDE